MPIIKICFIILFIIKSNYIKSQIDFDSTKNIVNYFYTEIDSLNFNLKFDKTLALDSSIKFEVSNSYLSHRFYIHFTANYCKNDSFTLINLDNIFGFKYLKHSSGGVNILENENKIINCKFYVKNKKLVFKENGFLKINIAVFENNNLIFTKFYFVPFRKIKNGIPYW